MLGPEGYPNTRLKSAAEYAIRGAIGFGVGSFVAFLLMLAPKMGPFGWFTGILMGFPLSGAIGGLSLAWPIRGDRNLLTIAFGYGIGFMIAGIVIPISLVAEEKPLSIYFLTIPFQAFGFAVGLGIAAAIGTAFISFRLALVAAIAFAIGGLISGIFLTPVSHLVQLLPAVPAASGGHDYLGVIFIELLVAYSLGGALLGAAMGYFFNFE
jgi:hypothetical protein